MGAGGRGWGLTASEVDESKEGRCNLIVWAALLDLWLQRKKKKMIANSNLEQGGTFTSFLRCEITQLREKQITQTKTSFILIYLWKK